MVMPCQVSGQAVVANSRKLPQPSVAAEAAGAGSVVGAVCASAEPEASKATTDVSNADLDDSILRAPCFVVYEHIQREGEYPSEQSCSAVLNHVMVRQPF